jgi:hypothetical protein
MHHFHTDRASYAGSYTKAELARQKMLLVCEHGPCMSTIYLHQPSQCIMYKSLSSLLKKLYYVCTRNGVRRTCGTHMPHMAMMIISLHAWACMSQKRCYTTFSICLVVVFCSVLFQKVVCAANDEALEACPSFLTFDLIDEE